MDKVTISVSVCSMDNLVENFFGNYENAIYEVLPWLNFCVLLGWICCLWILESPWDCLSLAVLEVIWNLLKKIKEMT